MRRKMHRKMHMLNHVCTIKHNKSEDILFITRILPQGAMNYLQPSLLGIVVSKRGQGQFLNDQPQRRGRRGRDLFSLGLQWRERFIQSTMEREREEISWRERQVQQLQCCRLRDVSERRLGQITNKMGPFKLPEQKDKKTGMCQLGWLACNPKK